MKPLAKAITAIAILMPISAEAQLGDPLGMDFEKPARVDHLQLNSSPDFAGTCHPTRVRFNGGIHVSGPLRVTYQWVRSDNKRIDGTINFDAAGNRAVSIDWDLTKSYSGWVRLVVVFPKRMETEKVRFHVNCG